MTCRIGAALLLTAGAGLATSIGSILGLFVRKSSHRFMGFTLGFSAGVMLLVSFVELLQESIVVLGFLSAHIGFFVGMTGIFVVDALVPHEYIGQHDYVDSRSVEHLKRTGLLVAFGIAIHNFPEGMATFAGTLKDLHLGMAIAVAIAIHNIPEGLAVSVPIFVSTGSRKKAFFWSFLSGASEPVGAALAAFVLMPFLSEAVLGWMLAVVAGIMVAIAIDELVPAAKSFGTEHTPIIGVIVGMAVMAFSLWLIG